MGPLLIKGWSESPMNGAALLVGFYSSIILTSAGIIFLFATAARLGPKITHALLGISALALACFGVYEFWLGAKSLWPM